MCSNASSTPLFAVMVTNQTNIVAVELNMVTKFKAQKNMIAEFKIFVWRPMPSPDDEDLELVGHHLVRLPAKLVGHHKVRRQGGGCGHGC